MILAQNTCRQGRFIDHTFYKTTSIKMQNSPSKKQSGSAEITKSVEIEQKVFNSNLIR